MLSAVQVVKLGAIAFIDLFSDLKFFKFSDYQRAKQQTDDKSG